MPSNDALFLHWKRAVWVLLMWMQATEQDVKLLPKDKNGWIMEQKDPRSVEKLAIVWESDEHIKGVKTYVSRLTKGCGCQLGATRINTASVLQTTKNVVPRASAVIVQIRPMDQ